MRRTIAVSFVIVGIMALFGCKPGTYYPFGQKVQNPDQTQSTVHYAPATGQPVLPGQPRAAQIVPG